MFRRSLNPFTITFWNIRSIIDGKAFVTHAEDQVDLFPSHATKSIQHRNAIKQMAGIDHQGHGKCLQRIECAHEHIDGDEFDRPGKDGQAHEHRIKKAETIDIHVDAIGQAEKPESRKDRDRIRKGTFEGLFHDLYLQDIPLFI